MFKEIDKFCSVCRDCCKSYCWLLEEEVKILSKLDVPILQLNKAFCIDSFERRDKKILLDNIPTCRFFKKRKCSIYPYRPLFCRLYPIQLIFNSKQQILFVIDLDCPFASQRNKQDLYQISLKLKYLLTKMDKQLLHSIVKQYYEVHKITKIYRKNFIKLLRVHLGKDKLLIKPLF